MESSGKYWIPVFNVLEKYCKVTLAHPKYIKPQKGNKTNRTVLIKNGILTQGAFVARYQWNYFSNKDGEIHNFTLCENCYDKFINNQVKKSFYKVYENEECEELNGITL